MGQNVLINSQETETEEMSSGKVGGGRKYMADIMGGGDGKESLSLGESNEIMCITKSEVMEILELHKSLQDKIKYLEGKFKHF